jgi:hypothetical protein
LRSFLTVFFDEFDTNFLMLPRLLYPDMDDSSLLLADLQAGQWKHPVGVTTI